jgi:hypothetical protein
VRIGLRRFSPSAVRQRTDDAHRRREGLPSRGAAVHADIPHGALFGRQEKRRPPIECHTRITVALHWNVALLFLIAY